MTKQETQIMKGVAILMMLWLHLFNMSEPLYQPLFYIKDIPFERYITYLTQPVGFFCFLSGYGMHVLYTKGVKDKHRWSRIGKLYMHWWMSIVLYLVIYQLLISTHSRWNTAFDIESIFGNITAFDTSWYHPGWFLLPYICLSLFAFKLFRLTDKLKVWQNLIIFWLLGLVISVLVTYNSNFVYSHRFVANISGIISLMPAFIFGAMAHQTSVIERLQIKTKVGW